MTVTRPTPAALHNLLRGPLTRLRAHRDRGSHAVEYAIGIGASAAVILAIYAAFRLGLAHIVASWVFG